MPSKEEERVGSMCSHRLALPPRRAIWIRETSNPNYSTGGLEKVVKVKYRVNWACPRNVSAGVCVSASVSVRLYVSGCVYECISGCVYECVMGVSMSVSVGVSSMSVSVGVSMSVLLTLVSMSVFGCVFLRDCLHIFVQLESVVRSEVNVVSWDDWTITNKCE